MNCEFCKKCPDFGDYTKGMFVSCSGGEKTLTVANFSNNRLFHCLYVLDGAIDDCSEDWFAMDAEKRMKILDSIRIKSVFPDDLCPYKTEILMQEWNDNNEK